MPRCILMILLCCIPAAAWSASALHHALTVVLDPQIHGLRIEDKLEWSAAPSAPVEFTLHAGLQPRAEGGAQLARIGTDEDGAIPFKRYRLTLPPGTTTATLHYGGMIHHPLTAQGEGAGHAMESTPGIIGPQGAVLSGASGWYPQFERFPRQSFAMTVTLPPEWEAVSQGARSARDNVVRWEESTPQEEIWLVAGPFTRYVRGDAPKAMVYLRQADPALAARYLDATERYLTLYSQFIGEYPYAKFALVENFWETGYGMPSFTLLGPKVIRLPFLLDSAYPHEVLHSWWGNGVYVDASQGNWSEGLTAYLADHLLQEQFGRGEQYRRDQLQAYAVYVAESGDFPLSRFRVRHSGATQAVGYGKGMMFFHMLRRELGDESFVAGLRRFYREARFTPAGYYHLRMAFEQEGGKDLGDFFAQWLERPGAPALALADTEFQDGGVRITLTQTQQEEPFRLQVPVVIGMADGRLLEHSVTTSDRHTTVILRAPGRPVCIAVDPRHDLFRRLLPGELPTTIGAVLGAERPLFVLPADAPPPLLEAYRRLATAWDPGKAGADVRSDRDVHALPHDRTVILLGWKNRLLVDTLLAPPNATEVLLEERRWSRRDYGVVLTARHNDQPLLWLAADDPTTVGALARKVPHYGKYSYLVFAAVSGEIRLKGQWAVEQSPLLRRTGTARCQPQPGAPLVR